MFTHINGRSSESLAIRRRRGSPWSWSFKKRCLPLLPSNHEELAAIFSIEYSPQNAGAYNIFKRHQKLCFLCSPSFGIKKEILSWRKKYETQAIGLFGNHNIHAANLPCTYMISKVQNETRTKIFKAMQDAKVIDKTSRSVRINKLMGWSKTF